MKISLVRSVLATAALLGCLTTASANPTPDYEPGVVEPAGGADAHNPSAAPPPDNEYGTTPAPAPARPEGNIMVLELDKFDDGSITTAKVRVSDTWKDNNPAMQVTFHIPGVHCERNTFKVGKACKNAGLKNIKCKPVGCPENGQDGQTVPVTATFEYQFEGQPPAAAPPANDNEYGAPPEPAAPPATKETQVVHRVVKNCGSCAAIGDPHMKTMDNAVFDFHTPGLYTLFESGTFKVYSFQNNCGNALNWGDIPSCIEGAAVAFGDSVVRFWYKDGRLDVAKGSQELKWMSVKKIAGQTEGFRVYVLADPQTYVDVTIGQWEGQEYKFVNIAIQAGSYFKNNEIKGLMGNWNGNPDDDEKDRQRLVERAQVPNGVADSIFSCAVNDCARFTSPASENDAIGVKLYKELPMLHQGFDAIEVTETTQFQPVITQPPGKRSLRQLTRARKPNPKLEARAKEVCPQVVHGVPFCKEILKDSLDFWVNACVTDVTTVGCIGGVDATKVAYLRECRRKMDAVIEAEVCEAKRSEAYKKHRMDLMFGDPNKCKDNCHGRGMCLASGCACQRGFSGVACEIEIKDYQ